MITSSRNSTAPRFITTCLGLAISIVAAAQTLPPPTPFPGLEDPIPAPLPQSAVSVGLQSVATGLVSPITGTFAPGHENDLFIVDQTGQVWDIQTGNANQGNQDNRGRDGRDSNGRKGASDHGGGNSGGGDGDGNGNGDGNRNGNPPSPPAPRVFLDVSSRLVTLGLSPTFKYDERGLLGLAFHPQFLQNGLFYTFTSEPAGTKTADFSTMSVNNPTGAAANCQSVILEWQVVDPRAGVLTVSSAMPRELLRIDKPYFNHNGGTLAFGQDGMLYISLGDGGNGNDTGIGHVPGGNAQDLSVILGKILRINPQGSNSANGQYGIPPDNPFVTVSGALGEIFEYGHRNPYRMSFDSRTGQLYVADVGQNSAEEVDLGRAGGNFGWPVKEGTFLFAVNAADPNILTSGYVYADSPGVPASMIDPVADYDHSDDGGKTEVRAAIIGGYVARGGGLGRLEGNYVFGDYGSGVGAPAPNGHILALFGNQIQSLQIAGRPAGLGLFVLGFATDSEGNIYLCGNTSGLVSGTNGEVLKLTSAVGRDD
jgi:hypothetical protein